MDLKGLTVVFWIKNTSFIAVLGGSPPPFTKKINKIVSENFPLAISKF